MLRDARRLLPLALFALAGCPGPRTVPDRQPVGKDFTGCLPLTGTSRSALRLGPDGRYLYWTEQVRLHGYQEDWPSIEVVRWPLAGGPIERLTHLVDNPYRVLPDGRLVGLDQGFVTLWDPSAAERISPTASIDHLELLASNDAVVYRAGEAVWRQPLQRESSRWLADADALLGVDGNAVFVAFQDNDQHGHLRRVDGVTGAVTELPWLDDVIKAVPGGLIVEDERGIGVRAPEGGELKTVLTGADWQIRVGPDAVKAWRKVGPRLDGALVTGAGADHVPPVVGGDSLEGFVRTPDGRVAYLVGHDLDGDAQITTGDEVDVCLAPADAKEVRVEPRTAPARWKRAGEMMAASVKDRLGGGTWHFAPGDATPGVYVEGAPARKDTAAIRADVRWLADQLGATSGDRTMFVDITYADGKRGFSEWWPGTGTRVAWAGTGGATVPDLADYDVTFKAAFATVDENEDDDEPGGSTMVRCSGTVTNTSDHRLVDLWADCVGGSDDAKIRVSAGAGGESFSLEPGQTGRFDDVVRRTGTSVLAVSIHTGPGYAEVPGFDLDRHARYVQLDALAAAIADRTDLIYKDADTGDGVVTVHLDALPGKKFAGWSGQAQEQAAATAQEQLAKDPVVLGGQRGDTVRLKITDGDRTWMYEDGQLEDGPLPDGD